MEALYSLDVSLFLFLNHTLGTPPGDVLWPLITDYDKLGPVRIVLLGIWLWLLIRGGRTGRTVALLLVPLLFFADTLSSSIIKPWIQRPRPCHTINGSVVVEGIRLLVDCGAGKSFPSSHAVNNLAIATLFGYYYRRWWWAFFAWGGLVALSRPAVGVHYPSDILAGGLIGMAVGAIVIGGWRLIEQRYFPPGPEPPATGIS